MADDNKTLRGTITKVVQVQLGVGNPGVAVTSDEPQQGYGLVCGDNGQEVYFIDSAVRNIPFGDLRTGQQVDYQLEDGPLMRAESICVSGDDDEVPDVGRFCRKPTD